MIGRVAEKEKILRCLRSGQREICVFYYDAQAVFGEVLAEHDEVAEKVASITFCEKLCGGVFKVTYKTSNSDTKACMHAGMPIQVINDGVIDSIAELEELLHTSVRAATLEQKAKVIIDIDVSKVLNDFLLAYHGYYANNKSIGYTSIRRGDSRYYDVTFTFQYTVDSQRLKEMEIQVSREVDKLAVQLFLPSMSAEVKAYVAHNYLARTVKYWSTCADVSAEVACIRQSAFGALIEKKCVCQGYAEAYKRLLNHEGIICEVLVGKVKKDKDGSHAWNAISFDGKNYYHVDVTWDAGSVYEKNDKYYGLSDEQMRAERLWTRKGCVICSGVRDVLDSAKREIKQNQREYIAAGIDKKYLS